MSGATRGRCSTCSADHRCDSGSPQPAPWTTGAVSRSSSSTRPTSPFRACSPSAAPATARACCFGSRVRTAARSITWYQVAGRVDLIARGLIAVSAPVQDPRVAILSENRLEMALIDLACLATGIVDVMIPATATENDVAYILRHARVGTVVVSTTEQLDKVQQAPRRRPRSSSTIVAFDADAAAVKGVLLVRRGAGAGRPRRRATRSASAATRRAHRRPRHRHVHLRHDRHPQGHLLLAPQHRLQALRPRPGAARDRRGRPCSSATCRCSTPSAASSR